MGECCSSASVIQGEDKVDLIFSDSNFKLNTMTDITLLNLLVNFRIQQDIYKKQVEENIIPALIEKGYTSNPYLKYHLSYFNEVLNNLQIKNNIYDVYILFYPFCDHTNEKADQTLFKNFYFIHRNITKAELFEVMEKYLKFITITLTKCVLEKEEDELIKNSLKELLVNVFTEVHVKESIPLILGNNITALADNQQVNMQQFTDAIENIGLTNYQKVRHFFIERYSPK